MSPTFGNLSSPFGGSSGQPSDVGAGGISDLMGLAREYLTGAVRQRGAKVRKRKLGAVPIGPPLHRSTNTGVSTLNT